MTDPLRVLVVATKPPWPPVGGGNAILHSLLEALAARGVALTVLAPTGSVPVSGDEPGYQLHTVSAAPAGWLRAGAALLTGASVTMTRYRLEPLAAAVERLVSELEPDVIHLEQVQLAWLIPLFAGRTPVLLRQQNVESDLTRRYARICSPLTSLLLGLEARRLARAEAHACAAADLVAAISEHDAAALAAMAPGARIRVLPPAWAPTVPLQPPPRLAGDPPIVCLGSFDWRPNRDGALWFLRRVWPRVAEALPGAVLHLAGPGSSSLRPAGTRVTRHGLVASPSELADPRAVVVAPVRVASGIRVRLLEAWSFGVPAVTTSQGGAGLVEDDGDGALLADDPAAFAAAVVRLGREPALRRALAERGRQRLAEFAAPAVAERALELYAEAAGLVVGATQPRRARSS